MYGMVCRRSVTFFLTFHSDKTLTPPFPKSLFSQVILSLHSYWIIIVASETVYWHWRIWGVPSVRHTMYRQAAITWVVFLPCVILLLTAILKKLKAVSIQCWFNFNWTPNCWILFLPKIDKYLRYLISINLRKRDREREGNRYSKWSYIFIHGSFCLKRKPLMNIRSISEIMRSIISISTCIRNGNF